MNILKLIILVRETITYYYEFSYSVNVHHYIHYYINGVFNLCQHLIKIYSTYAYKQNTIGVVITITNQQQIKYSQYF